MPIRACSSLSSFKICACTVTSNAVVGSSAISSSGRLASAIAIITRWRCPPDNWCGISTQPRFGIANTDLVEQVDHAFPDFGAALPVQFDDLADLPLDCVQRVQRRHRLLEHHRDLGAANLAQSSLADSEHVFALEEHLSRRVP